MSLRTLRFAFIFALGLPAHLPMQAFARPPSRPGGRVLPPRPRARGRPPVRRVRVADPLQKWANSGHAYCDAKVLGGLWQTSAFQAKKIAGQKMNRGNYRGVNSALRRGRKLASRRAGAVCSYHEAGYSYRDAEVLAAAWHVPVAQAKTTIVRKVFMGRHDAMRKLISRRSARQPFAHPANRGPADNKVFASRSTGDAREAFFSAGYGYCDAKALGAMWRTSPFQAKAMGGYMLVGGGRKTLSGTLHMSRKLAARTHKGACTFADAGFSARDAATLGRAWRMKPKQARARAERKLLWGGEGARRAMVRGVLRNGQP